MTDDTLKDRPTQEEITELIGDKDLNGWNVVDWELEAGMYDDTTVTVEFEYDHIEAIMGDVDNFGLRNVVLTTIEAGDYSNGVPQEKVVSDVTGEKEEFTEDMVETAIEQLKQKGEIYEPETGKLRAT